MTTPTIIQQNATHKAVREHGRINIYLKGIDYEYIHMPDELLYFILEDEEDDLFEIFERYDEQNRINMAEFQASFS